jgi:hypothetical protein
MLDDHATLTAPTTEPPFTDPAVLCGSCKHQPATRVVHFDAVVGGHGEGLDTERWLLLRCERVNCLLDSPGDGAVADFEPLTAEAAARLSGEQLIGARAPGVIELAFFYALGRSDYSVFQAGSALRLHAGDLPTAVLRHVVLRIERAVALGQAGRRLDVEEWQRTAEVLRDAARLAAVR